jgi:HD-like signal output (HDOD) protein
LSVAIERSACESCNIDKVAMNTTPEELAAEVSTLVSLHEVYIQLNALLDEPNTTAADLGEVIRHDPGLATRLLKIVNSAFYGFASRIDDLDRAVTIVGRNDLRDLLLATVAVETFNKIETELVDMSTFWHHSVFCALIARGLGKRCNTPRAERLFAAGMLHDVGQLVIYHELPELAREALAAAEASDDGLYRAERDVLGFTHGEVGAALFQAWGLPQSLQAVARWHHEPLAGIDYLFENAIVHLANSAANAVEPGRNILDCRPIRHPGSWRLTGLTEEALESAVSEAEVQFLEVIRIISPDAPLI